MVTRVASIRRCFFQDRLLQFARLSSQVLQGYQSCRRWLDVQPRSVEEEQGRRRLMSVVEAVELKVSAWLT
jgi:hypothetical protein